MEHIELGTVLTGNRYAALMEDDDALAKPQRLTNLEEDEGTGHDARCMHANSESKLWPMKNAPDL